MANTNLKRPLKSTKSLQMLERRHRTDFSPLFCLCLQFGRGNRFRMKSLSNMDVFDKRNETIISVRPPVASVYELKPHFEL